MQTPFELDALADAHQYQKWIFESVASDLGNRILELGAGIGNLSQWLPSRELLVLSELEPEFIEVLKSKPGIRDKKNTVILQIDLGRSIFDQVSEYDLDTIVSFNVMEHVEDDLSAIRDQVRILKESKASGPKKLVLFVPAFNFAYGSLDRIFKHYRRYDAGMMNKIFHKIDPRLKPQMRYFNLLSFPGWYVQGKVLKKTEIKKSQIRILEKVIPWWKPVDRFLMRVLRIPLGQSLVCVVNID